mmetsp:Transcript_23050/g.35662  ORF Transcript_23050/g.35662 Transcript_23050/m.35662 type:complete len:114 (-) Transcript_23050:371-712(-)
MTVLTNRTHKATMKDFEERSKNYLNQLQSSGESAARYDFNCGPSVFTHQLHVDKNSIVFSAILSPDYPDALAKKFLETLSKNLYDADPIEFKRNPQTISQLDSNLKFNIYTMH